MSISDPKHRATGHLRLRHGKRGDVWYAKVRTPDGRNIQPRIGPAHDGRGRCPTGAYTERMAEAELRRFLTALEDGTDPRSTAPTGRTFEHACAEFIRHRRDEKRLSVSTLRDYEVTIDKILTPTVGASTPIESVTEDDVKRVRAELLAKAQAPRTAVKHFQVMYAVLERARRNKWITVNPAADVERIHVDKPTGLYRALEPVQVMNLARSATTEQESAIYIVAAFTGLRLGELRALRWRNVRFALESILVERNLPEHGEEKTPKSGRGRSVPLVPQAAVALDGLSKRDHLTGPDDHVFLNALGGPVNGDIVRRDWRKAMKSAGLGDLISKDLPRGDRLRFHDMRHTFGTLAARRWPLPEVQAVMGHSDITTTMIYVHAKPRTRQATELGSLIDGELGDAENFAPDFAPNSALRPQLSATQSN